MTKWLTAFSFPTRSYFGVAYAQVLRQYVGPFDRETVSRVLLRTRLLMHMLTRQRIQIRSMNSRKPILPRQYAFHRVKTITCMEASCQVYRGDQRAFEMPRLDKLCYGTTDNYEVLLSLGTPCTQRGRARFPVLSVICSIFPPYTCGYGHMECLRTSCE